MTSEIVYSFNPDNGQMRLKLKNLSNHELRCIMLGLWRCLERGDQEDQIEELRHYLDRPDEELPPLSRAIARGEEEPDALLAV